MSGKLLPSFVLSIFIQLNERDFLKSMSEISFKEKENYGDSFMDGLACS